MLDDSEGITLQSLGGVFIATLIGLALAMITLVVEVVMQKKKEKNKVEEIRINQDPMGTKLATTKGSGLPAITTD